MMQAMHSLTRNLAQTGHPPSLSFGTRYKLTWFTYLRGIVTSVAKTGQLQTVAQHLGAMCQRLMHYITHY